MSAGTGFAVERDDLSPVGWTRITVEGPPPPGYRYPYPTGYMVFFHSRYDGDGPATAPEPGTECTAAAWFGHAEVRAHCANPDWLSLLTTPSSP